MASGGGFKIGPLTCRTSNRPKVAMYIGVEPTMVVAFARFVRKLKDETSDQQTYTNVVVTYVDTVQYSQIRAKRLQSFCVIG